MIGHLALSNVSSSTGNWPLSLQIFFAGSIQKRGNSASNSNVNYILNLNILVDQLKAATLHEQTGRTAQGSLVY